MDKLKAALFRLDELQFEMEVLSGFIFVLYDSMDNGDLAVNEQHKMAIHGIEQIANSIRKEFREQVEIGFEGLIEEKKVQN